MDTWTVAKWMSESAKKVFNAVTTGPSDAIKFGDKTMERKPTWDCNTHHRIQGWRTRSGSGNDSHALTDQIIVDVRLRDTDDGFSYNANYAQNHSVKMKLTHNGKTVYSWEQGGVQDASTDDWSSSMPKLITLPGKWILYADSEAAQCPVPKGGFKEVGSFIAKEAHEGCFGQNRDESETMGECGECWDGYTEDDDGVCVADSQGSGDNGGSDSDSDASTDNTQLYMIGGGALLLLLIIKKRKKKE